ncbi:hypothetical protein PGT21_010711 [Puccinia graminis f. sp. tritici]|uniref:Peptidase A1 domain-containing protein n=1 Tax=Puccinia graminis f. sp. tritici TaxID=56615 RepID=A0A5B0NC63_PUCGR|nr:hypothetical protein PGT21_010711 [Puccinia graminis f. sp. tritici]
MEEDLSKVTISSAQTTEETNRHVVDNLPSLGPIGVKVNGYDCEGSLCPGLLFNFISEEEARKVDFDVHPQDIWLPGVCEEDIKITGIALATVAMEGISETTSFLVTQKNGPLIFGKPFMNDFLAEISYNNQLAPTLACFGSGGTTHLRIPFNLTST